MAARLGYGGLANTNGARDFTGKETAEIIAAGAVSQMRRSSSRRYGYGYRYIRLGLAILWRLA